MTSPPDDLPPLGSWKLVYALVVLSAVTLMVGLYWFTQAYNIPLEAR